MENQRKILKEIVARVTKALPHLVAVDNFASTVLGNSINQLETGAVGAVMAQTLKSDGVDVAKVVMPVQDNGLFVVVDFMNGDTGSVNFSDLPSESGVIRAVSSHIIEELSK
ncbi:hypothetical protein [Vibrio sp. WXL210]|uniref:hypothetical protein n=1 Tax=Vibrio sp. WXL210 TaxID=3450709 RepID=UPI003EC8DFB6